MPRTKASKAHGKNASISATTEEEESLPIKEGKKKKVSNITSFFLIYCFRQYIIAILMY
jgi:hypothetical protein